MFNKWIELGLSKNKKWLNKFTILKLFNQIKIKRIKKNKLQIFSENVYSPSVFLYSEHMVSNYHTHYALL